MKLVKVNNLSRDGRSRYSATCLLSKELNLEVLPVTDEGKIHFTSPTFAEIVDVLTRKFKIEEMLDLFCGSGALSKIALLNGVTKIKSVDVFTGATEINLRGYANKVEVVQENVFEINFNGHYDLVTVDSPTILIENVVQGLIPKIKSDLLVLYYGGKGNIEIDERVENQLNHLFKEVFFIHYQPKHACCVSNKIGAEYINYLRKIF